MASAIVTQRPSFTSTKSVAASGSSALSRHVPQSTARISFAPAVAIAGARSPSSLASAQGPYLANIPHPGDALPSSFPWTGRLERNIGRAPGRVRTDTADPFRRPASTLGLRGRTNNTPKSLSARLSGLCAKTSAFVPNFVIFEIGTDVTLVRKDLTSSARSAEAGRLARQAEDRVGHAWGDPAGGRVLLVRGG